MARVSQLVDDLKEAAAALAPGAGGAAAGANAAGSWPGAGAGAGLGTPATLSPGPEADHVMMVSHLGALCRRELDQLADAVCNVSSFAQVWY